MISAFLHFFTIPFIVFGALKIYSLWRKQQFKNNIHKNLFLFFCFYMGHHFFLSVPILVGMNMASVAVGYVIAIVFLFLALIPVVMIESQLVEASSKKSHAVMTLIIALAFVVTILQSVQLPQPFIEKGFVFWNANLSMSLLTSIVTFLIGMHMLFIMGPHWPKNITLRQKVKASLFAMGCSVLAFAGLIYFPSHQLVQTVIATVAGYVGLVILLISLTLKNDKIAALQINAKVQD